MKHKFGLIVSVIWALVGGYLGNEWAVKRAWEQTSAQVDECLRTYSVRPRSNDGGIWTPCWEHFGENYRRNVAGHWWAAVGLGLLPILIVWLFAYLFVNPHLGIRRGK